MSQQVLSLQGRNIVVTGAAQGAVHGLVNNAGITRPAMIEKMTVEQWQQVLDVHLSGSFYFLQAVGRHALARARAGDRSSASIVSISSDAGRRGTIGQLNYGAAKAGLLGLTMCAAREWAKYNVRVNTVGFGVVETPMTETIPAARSSPTPTCSRFRWGAGRKRATWPGRCASCCPTRLRTSRGSTCRPTAATPSAPERSTT
jgi:NAD(P)-dependent dehydrogenase (short-subunit alcohol dehydrogenase family)